MLEIGKKQKLMVVKKVEFGVYLGEHLAAEASERVLLPAKQAGDAVSVGEYIEVFLYRDSKDRMIATTATPFISLGQVAKLTVAQTGKFGAFLDWGLEKDLMLPFKEQVYPVKQGDSVLAALYVDKSGRLCATMKVYPYLKTDSPYRKEDMVQGTVYEIIENMGAFVAVDDRYSGLIPARECYGSLRVGQTIEARVTEVKADGKLNLSVRQKAYLQMEKDAEELKKLLDSYNGVFPFTEKASPEVIRRETQMSKNEFKRAIGHLLKQGYISIQDGRIRKA